MSLKMLREDVCRRLAEQRDFPVEVIAAANILVGVIDVHRPLGPDGKHGNRHTATCGCEDKGDWSGPDALPI